jgi:hypothetical protein
VRSKKEWKMGRRVAMLPTVIPMAFSAKPQMSTSETAKRKSVWFVRFMVYLRRMQAEREALDLGFC